MVSTCYSLRGLSANENFRATQYISGINVLFSVSSVVVKSETLIWCSEKRCWFVVSLWAGLSGHN